MKPQIVLKKRILATSIALLLIVATQVQAQSERRGRGRGLYGDWNVTIQFGERQMQSILSFSRNAERQLTAQWISYFGVTELQDVKLEENKLTFTQVFRRRDTEYTSKFAGTIQDGKLTGTLTSDRGDVKVTGERPPRTPRVVGSWEMAIQVGEREYKGTLDITAGEKGALSGVWKSQRGERKLTDLKYADRKLTFKRVVDTGEQTWETTFEGTVEWNSLTGVFKSERGEAKAEGKRAGTALIGRWDLEIATDDGTRKQRLVVQRDLSALFGSLPIKKLALDGDKISFKSVLEFGDRKFEMSFAGKVEGDTLTGELTSSRGTRKVTGKKRPWRTRGRGGRGARPSPPSTTGE